MSTLIDRHPCGCEHLSQFCYRCLGLLSPTTEAAIAGRIDNLLTHGLREKAVEVISRRERERANYTKANFRSSAKAVVRG